jgi:hypothetical protein
VGPDYDYVVVTHHTLKSDIVLSFIDTIAEHEAGENGSKNANFERGAACPRGTCDLHNRSNLCALEWPHRGFACKLPKAAPNREPERRVGWQVVALVMTR